MVFTSIRTTALSITMLDLNTQEIDMDVVICHGSSLGIKRMKKENFLMRRAEDIYLSTNTFAWTFVSTSADIAMCRTLNTVI